ncbi:MAG: hypothetical protein J2P33_19750, partial [Actinobacteria bacterium]|nr:hypothetical protein [Actinomycetota bacterium]
AGPGGQAAPGVPGARPASAPWREQVRAGLVNLGWQARDADQAIAAVEAELAESAAAGGPESNGDRPSGTAAGEEPDVAVMLRAALRKLSPA